MSALVVTVGVALGADEHDVAALTHALREAGLEVTGHFAVDDDEVTLERALTMGSEVTIVVAGGGSSSGDVVRRTLARMGGSRLVLNERALDALRETYRRRDRPLPRRAERLALLPQGAVLWLSPESDPAFGLETDGRVVAVLPRGGDLAAIVRQHLVPFLAGRTNAGEAVLTRTLRTAGASIADVEERLAGIPRADGGEAAITVLPAAGGDFVLVKDLSYCFFCGAPDPRRFIFGRAAPPCEVPPYASYPVRVRGVLDVGTYQVDGRLHSRIRIRAVRIEGL